MPNKKQIEDALKAPPYKDAAEVEKDLTKKIKDHLKVGGRKLFFTLPDKQVATEIFGAFSIRKTSKIYEYDKASALVVRDLEKEVVGKHADDDCHHIAVVIDPAKKGHDIWVDAFPLGAAAVKALKPLH